jgi:serine kinase of HPr protein (carbohydrate metabolism regulator)
MAKAEENSVWLTIQTHLNIIAVAELVDISCIIIVENMDIDEDTIIKAKELNIPIFKTEKQAYEVAKELSKLGI